MTMTSSIMYWMDWIGLCEKFIKAHFDMDFFIDHEEQWKVNNLSASHGTMLEHECHRDFSLFTSL